MKTAAMMTMAAMLGSVAWAQAKSDDQKVVACFEESGNDIVEGPQARIIASEVFRSAGVKLEWLKGRQPCEGQRDRVIAVGASTTTPANLLPGALAYTREFEGVRIQLFYDRIANRARDLRPYLLAYVLVHEITHILQAINRHSDSGIMKAQWDDREHDLMMRTRLWFTEQDIEMIHRGLALRAARRASGTLVAAAGLAAAQPVAER